MSTPDTVPCDAHTTVTIDAPFRHMCPFVHEVDNGTAQITWVTEGNTIELHSLAHHLDTYRDVEISHEELTRQLRDALDALDGLTITHITTTWHTAGMEVTCSTSPTHAGRQR